MKTPVLFIGFALLTLTNAAQASWYQGFCSNAEGTVKTALGHNQNYIQLTKREFSNGNTRETVIRDDEGKIAQHSVGSEVKIADENETRCNADGSMGWWNSRKVTALTVKLVNNDGSLFDRDIVGVSKDLKSVSAELVCETRMNSMTPCRKK